jgi:hypothetical protein
VVGSVDTKIVDTKDGDGCVDKKYGRWVGTVAGTMNAEVVETVGRRRMKGESGWLQVQEARDGR